MEFEFPDTGEGVTEGTFLKWLVEEGEEIEEDETVAEVETDKAVVDIPAPANGVVTSLKAEAGDQISVGDVIMELDTDAGGGDVEEETESEEDSEETESEGQTETEEDTTEDTEPEEKEAADESPASTGSGDVLALPKVRKLAEEKGVDLASIKTGERITEDEVLEAAEGETGAKEEADEQEQTVEEEVSTEEPEEGEDQDVSTGEEVQETSGVKATPATRKLAREKNVDIQSIEGSGRGGKITREDVLNAAEGETGAKEDEAGEAEVEESSEESSTAKEKHKVPEGQEEERVALSEMEQYIASEMEKSKYTAPHVTHVDTADVTKLVEIRNEKKDEVDVHLTYLPFIMKATLLALKQHPRLNAEYDEEENEVVLKYHYEFNIAVDTEDGLVTPQVPEVDEKNIVDLAREIGEKAESARNGELDVEDKQKGTFAITNVGAIGGEMFTPVIEYPQVAILGIGKIQETAEVVDGDVKPRNTVKLSLSYDHRVVDGATAARFVNTIIENLEDPDHMLLEL